MTMNSMPQSGAQIRESSSRYQPSKIGQQKSAIMVSSVGLVAIIVGIITGCLWSPVYNSIVHRELILSPVSKSFSMWKETPIPMYLKIYLFNWTNPDDFYVGSRVKPNFVEMGPYVFKEVDYKVNKVWNDENGTVTFRQRKVWHFVEEMSTGSLNDRVTNLNTILATVAYMMRDDNKLAKFSARVGLTLTGEKLTVTKTVRELLFEGYNDPLLTLSSPLRKYKLINLVPFDKFGWFYQRNGSDTYDGTFNMLTGSRNIEDLGTIKEWNYSNKSKYQNSCGGIGGTLGDLWPPLKDKKTVSFFAPDICTSLSLAYSNTAKYLGLTGYKYVSSKDMLDNGTNVPSMACYCKDVECVPSGAFNVSRCKFGAPAFISLPHFYLADESYRTAINGMRPHKEDHEFSMIVEPTAGIPLQVSAKVQLNLMVQPNPVMGIFKKVPKTFIPMFWFKQEANLTSSLANQVRFVLILPMLGHVIFFGIAGIGFLLVFIGFGCYVRRRRRADDAQGLISKAEKTAVIRSDDHSSLAQG